MKSVTTNKIPAFSITETIISMLVIAIVISVVFVLYAAINNQVNTYRITSDNISSQHRLSYLLNKDINAYQNMTLTNNQLSFFSHDSSKIYYMINQKKITRKDLTTIDTFHYPTRDIKLDTVQSITGKIFSTLVLSSADQTDKELFFYKRIYPDRMLNY